MSQVKLPAPSVAELVQELAATLERQIDLQAGLHTAIREKLEAMRRVDTTAIYAAARREGEVIAEAAEADDRRRQAAGRLAAMLGVRSEDDRLPSLRMLAADLDSTARDRLGLLGGRLAEAMLKVAEANRVVDMVCRAMMAHFRNMFAVMTQDGEVTPTYSAGGAIGPAAGPRVLDAVG